MKIIRAEEFHNPEIVRMCSGLLFIAYQQIIKGVNYVRHFMTNDFFGNLKFKLYDFAVQFYSL